MIPKNVIINAAHRAGFDLVGVVPATALAEERKRFEEWMIEGNHSTLRYLERNVEKRFDARLLVEGSRSIVICAVSYLSHISRGYAEGCRTKIASYALARDYHLTIKEMLHSLAEELKKVSPDMQYRAFTDSVPLAEKSLAVRAGLGWIGRNSLLVTPQYGSMLLLGELVINEDVDIYDEPVMKDGCGGCRMCRDNCPNGAIMDNRLVDTRRCISCRTIEREGECGAINLDGWIFGCDACQSVCPYNRRAPLHGNPRFDAVIDVTSLDEDRWRQMTDEEFARIASHTPLTRAGLERIRANISNKG